MVWVGVGLARAGSDEKDMFRGLVGDGWREWVRGEDEMGWDAKKGQRRRRSSMGFCK